MPRSSAFTINKPRSVLATMLKVAAIFEPLSERPDISCLAWVREDSRSSSIARALGGEARTFFDLGIHRTALVPIRYLVSSVRTLGYLLGRRPRAVIVQAPPVPAAALVWVWAKLARAPVVIDSHPSSFGLEGDHARHHLMRPLLAQLARRSDGCIVTTPRLGEQVRRWKGSPLVVHEAPMTWSDRIHPRDCSGGRRVLFVNTFAPDEPWREALDAARLMPEVTFQVTGDLRRRPQGTPPGPPNVEWVGYLGPDQYVTALTQADVVMTLTSRLDSVQRSAHEAVDALRPVVLSDWPHMRELFPHAVFVENTAPGIRAGVEEALRRCAELVALAPEARAMQHRRWSRQLKELRTALRLA
jgi:glycosyltransferase involved in cell wall biosynthesis